MEAQELDKLIDRIIPHIREREHVSSFNKPRSGPVLNVETDADIKRHIMDTLNDPETKGFAATPDGKKMYFYNERTNTIVILDPDAPSGGSAFRPKNPNQGKTAFEKYKNDCAVKLGAQPSVVAGGIDGVEKNHATSPKPPSPKSEPPHAQAPDQPSVKAPPVINAEIEKIRLNPATEAFKDPQTGSKFLLSADKKTLIEIDAKGAATIREGAEDAFKSIYRGVYAATKEAPDLVKGAKALDMLADGAKGASFIGLHADDAAKIAKVAGKLAKVLPIIGAAAAAAEMTGLMKDAMKAERFGLLSREALVAYTAICTGNTAAGLGGFITSTAGEAGTMAAMELWAKKYNVPPHVLKDLKPSGLLQMGLDAANGLAPAPRDPASKNNRLGGGGERSRGMSNESVMYGEGGEKLPKTFSNAASNEFLLPTDGDLPPEVQTLADHVQRIKNIEDKMEIVKLGDNNQDALKEMRLQRDAAELKMAQTIMDFEESGSMTAASHFAKDYAEKFEGNDNRTMEAKNNIEDLLQQLPGDGTSNTPQSGTRKL